MINDQINKLKSKIKEFDNKVIYIELEDAIQFHTSIEDSKIIISNEKLIISDEVQKDFIIELHYLDSINVEDNMIYLTMSNDLRITIGC